MKPSWLPVTKASVGFGGSLQKALDIVEQSAVEMGDHLARRVLLLKPEIMIF
jgi:hypothetical protein